MRAHFQYLRYVLRHKWFVFWACVRLGVPIWRALAHDWTKFTRAEWGPYVRRFYGPNASRPSAGSAGYRHQSGNDPDFDAAWQHHWQHNPHHPEYWVHAEEDGILRANWMPVTYVREMVADWIGAGKAQGKPDIEAWYLANKDRIKLHGASRYLATQVLKEAQHQGLIP